MTIKLPEEMTISLGSESQDFAVKSGPVQAYGKSVPNLLFGLLFLGLAYGCIAFMPDEFFKGEALRIIKEALSKTTATEETQGALFLFIVFFIMLFVGLYLLIPAIIKMVRSGGFFVSTPSRLLNYRKGEMNSYDWSQFNGNITVRGTNKKGNITLEMKTGYIASDHRAGSKYVPIEIYISSVAGIYEIEQICRKRIKENDPN